MSVRTLPSLYVNKMIPYLWLLRLYSLYTVLLTFFALSADANVAFANCRDLRQWNANGDLQSYGDYSDLANEAVDNMVSMAENARKVIRRVNQDRASFFDESRATLMFAALQGGSANTAVGSGRWTTIYSKAYLDSMRFDLPAIS